MGVFSIGKTAVLALFVTQGSLAQSVTTTVPTETTIVLDGGSQTLTNTVLKTYEITFETTHVYTITSFRDITMTSTLSDANTKKNTLPTSSGPTTISSVVPPVESDDNSNLNGEPVKHSSGRSLTSNGVSTNRHLSSPTSSSMNIKKNSSPSDSSTGSTSPKSSGTPTLSVKTNRNDSPTSSKVNFKSSVAFSGSNIDTKSNGRSSTGSSVGTSSLRSAVGSMSNSSPTSSTVSSRVSGLSSTSSLDTKTVNSPAGSSATKSNSSPTSSNASTKRISVGMSTKESPTGSNVRPKSNRLLTGSSVSTKSSTSSPLSDMDTSSKSNSPTASVSTNSNSGSPRVSKPSRSYSSGFPSSSSPSRNNNDNDAFRRESVSTNSIIFASYSTAPSGASITRYGTSSSGIGTSTTGSSTSVSNRGLISSTSKESAGKSSLLYPNTTSHTMIPNTQRASSTSETRTTEKLSKALFTTNIRLTSSPTVSLNGNGGPQAGSSARTDANSAVSPTVSSVHTVNIGVLPHGSGITTNRVSTDTSNTNSNEVSPPASGVKMDASPVGSGVITRSNESPTGPGVKINNKKASPTASSGRTNSNAVSSKSRETTMSVDVTTSQSGLQTHVGTPAGSDKSSSSKKGTLTDSSVHVFDSVSSSTILSAHNSSSIPTHSKVKSNEKDSGRATATTANPTSGENGFPVGTVVETSTTTTENGTIISGTSSQSYDNKITSTSGLNTHYSRSLDGNNDMRTRSEAKPTGTVAITNTAEFNSHGSNPVTANSEYLIPTGKVSGHSGSSTASSSGFGPVANVARSLKPVSLLTGFSLIAIIM